jgi:hypothetical protein
MLHRTVLHIPQHTDLTSHSTPSLPAAFFTGEICFALASSASTPSSRESTTRRSLQTGRFRAGSTRLRRRGFAHSLSLSRTLLALVRVHDLAQHVFYVDTCNALRCVRRSALTPVRLPQAIYAETQIMTSGPISVSPLRKCTHEY